VTAIICETKQNKIKNKPQYLGMVPYVYIPSTQEVALGRWVPGHPVLHSKIESQTIANKKAKWNENK
jgi:hypothetical protein